MKWCGFKRWPARFFAVALAMGVLVGPAVSQEDKQAESFSRYEQRLLRYKTGWAKLIPDYSKFQFAGGMGMVSFGTGWDYGKNRQWETDVFIGYLPRFAGEHGHVTLTLKENYYPWKIKLNPAKSYSHWTFEPFSTSLYINKIFGQGQFWAKQPEKYPDKYYVLATNLRFNLAFGQRINFSVKNPHFANTVSFFYEVGTNDLYVICAIQNRVLKLHDIFSLSLGLKFQFL